MQLGSYGGRKGPNLVSSSVSLHPSKSFFTGHFIHVKGTICGITLTVCC